VAYLYRYFKHKSDGIISRKESKPGSFKTKVVLQVIMILTTLAMCITNVANNWGRESLLNWNVLYLGPAAVWVLSLHL
jgi:hypothetical protein